MEAQAQPSDLELEAKLAKKILAMEADCGYVQKDKKNPQQNYRYASAEAVLKKISAAAVEHGVASYPRYEVLQSEVVEVGQNKTRMRLVTARCVLRLVDADTGYGRDAEGLGSGSDTLDKAPMKAQTASHKYAWMGLLNISTGDDPEADRLTVLGVAAEDESQETNTAADMEEAMPSDPPVVAAFAAIGVSRAQLESLIQRDLLPDVKIPTDERALLERAYKDIRAKKTTWEQVVAGHVIKETATAGA